MAFHLEVSRSLNRARVFNLDEAGLTRVLAPWAQGQPVEIGEREWDPDESELIVLDGPELAGPELAMGQGWNNAERVSRDVSREVLERLRADVRQQYAVAIMADEQETHSAIESVLLDLGLRAVDWSGARAGILDPGADANAARAVAAVVAVEEPTTALTFEVGMAMGAFGGRVVVLQVEAGTLPGELAATDPIRIDQPEWPQVLAERLRLAGVLAA
jgi:hypothetical protein